MFRTLPAGYMEIGESAAEGAIRETWEEAGAEVEVLSPFAQLDIPRIGQVRRNTCLLTVVWRLSHDDVCILIFLFFGADLHNFLGKIEEAPLFPRSRIIGLQAFLIWWYSFWFFGIFINVGYLKLGRASFKNYSWLFVSLTPWLFY